MGVTLECRKTKRCMDMGYGGFYRLRRTVAQLAGEKIGTLYEELITLGYYDGEDEACVKRFCDYDRRVEKAAAEEKISEKVMQFLYDGDCHGVTRYGACKELLKVIGDYDDNYLYGYYNTGDAGKFARFKEILQDCVENKCDMVWS